MKRTDVLKNEYFTWLVDLVCKGRYDRGVSFRKLLVHLHDTEFRYLLLRDENRAEAGIDLRRRFAFGILGYSDLHEITDELRGPCSVLEMMVALAIKCEDLMDDTRVGDRTAQWFWNMIVNLGLGSFTDDRYNKRVVTDILDTFLDRKYAPDGRGGLFTIRDCDDDLRQVEIWCQLTWYLDSIT